MLSAELPAAVVQVMTALRQLGGTGVLIQYPTPGLIIGSDTRASLLTTTELYEADGNPVLVVVASDHRADPFNLASVLGATDVAPIPEQRAAHWTAQDPGAMSPVGNPIDLRVVLDVELAHAPHILVPAGHPDFAFVTSYAELLQITAGIAAEVGDLPRTPRATAR